ncbi:MAG: hypothetical protein Kow0062_02970 [Acidobacteriota bacterium]|nr:MAG: TVP38/TMEM64 family protein [Acidobacteriota bacterium]
MDTGEVPGARSTPAGRGWWKLGAAVAVVAAGAVIARRIGLLDRLSPEWIAANVDGLRAFADGLGPLAPLAFVALWVVAAVFFVPGLPLTIAGAIVFGPVRGTLYTSIGATLGATAAFVVGRYGGRGLVDGLVARHPALRRIDDGVRRNGWLMLLVTRLVPVFPFNAQNYVYGLTPIPLATYAAISWLAMIPGTLAYNLLADSILAGDLRHAATRALAAGAILLVLAVASTALARRFGPGRGGDAGARADRRAAVADQEPGEGAVCPSTER